MNKNLVRLVSWLIIWLAVVGVYVLISTPNTKEQVGQSSLLLIQGNTLIGIPQIKGTQVLATVTAYNPVPEQTDNTPDVFASGNKVYEGGIACPRYLQLGIFVEIDGKMYVCEDRTALKHDGTFDILMFDYQEAIVWGRQVKSVIIY